MIAILLAAAVLCPHPHRNPGVIAKWRKTHPCPTACRTFVKEEGKFKLYRQCGRCQVDHICARACGGPDTVDNLQWLSAEENRTKSADCSLCKGPLKCD